MTDEQDEDRVVREAWLALTLEMTSSDTNMKRRQAAQRVVEQAVSARTVARLARRQGPLYTDAINEAAMRKYADAAGGTGPMLVAEALAELDASRAACAARDETVAKLEAELAEGLAIRAYLIGLNEDYGDGPVTPLDVVKRIVAERDALRAKLEEPEAIAEAERSIAASYLAERDDARAKLAALCGALKQIQPHGGSDALKALEDALEAARGA